MKRYVQYLATASFVIEVDVPEDTPADQVTAKARELADEKCPEVEPGSLCWQCARDWDLSDAEQDTSEDGVWS
ncbi:MAG TPA: hypothetical protein VIP77_16020 [Jiangellaceae bacterium]